MRVVLVLAALVLAGCAGEPPTSPEGDEVFDDLGGEVTSTTGLVRGVVFDDTITPVEGATVAVKSVGREVLTTPEGAFVIDQLESGTYFLEVSKIGFAAVQSSALVEAGVDRPPIVKIQLQRTPSTLPYIIPDQWDGFIQCSVRVGTANQAGSVGVNACNGVDTQDVNHPLENFGPEPQYLQSELVWESTQAFGSDLSFVMGPPSCVDVKYNRADGPSPLVMRMNATSLEDPDNGDDPIGPDEGVCLRVFTFTSGQFQHVWGMQVEQGFQQFSHAFYNFAPDGEWLFVLDGPHPLPS